MANNEEEKMMQNAQDIEIYGEARKVFGKREMLWNIQRQIFVAKQKGKTINEEWLIKILNSIEQLQRVEEQNWDMEQYMDSELERDIIKESKLIQEKFKIKE